MNSSQQNQPFTEEEQKLMSKNGSTPKATDRPTKPTGATSFPAKTEKPSTDPHQQASQALALKVQEKAEALQEVADIEATQAWEEEMQGITAYATAKFKAVRASTTAKAALRQQLRQQLEEVEHPIASVEEAQDFFSLFGSPSGRGSLPSAS